MCHSPGPGRDGSGLPDQDDGRPRPPPAAGSLIDGKYRILEEIGHGGMGVVYKAEDIKLQRTVALKFLPPHLADSEELKERFLIEARAAALPSQPGICVIHEVGETEARPYIARDVRAETRSSGSGPDQLCDQDQDPDFDAQRPVRFDFRPGAEY
jgi:serine/threonine protein kinase